MSKKLRRNCQMKPQKMAVFSPVLQTISSVIIPGIHWGIPVFIFFLKVPLAICLGILPKNHSTFVLRIQESGNFVGDFPGNLLSSENSLDKFSRCYHKVFRRNFRRNLLWKLRMCWINCWRYFQRKFRMCFQWEI